MDPERRKNAGKRYGTRGAAGGEPADRNGKQQTKLKDKKKIRNRRHIPVYTEDTSRQTRNRR